MPHPRGMRTQRRRTKKLTIAFWFHLRGEPGWKCDACRSAGLEASRRCGFLGFRSTETDSPVWARGLVVLNHCPKPMILPSSMALLHAYAWWRRGAKEYRPPMRAKCADAFLLLESLRQQSIQEAPSS